MKEKFSYMEKLEKIGIRIMGCIGAALAFFLVLYAWRYTRRLYYSEAILDYPDKPFWNVLCLAAALVLAWLVGRLAGHISDRALHIAAIACALWTVTACCILAYAADIYAVADQLQLYVAADAFFTGDTGWLVDYDYFYMFPFQFGMVELYALVFRIAGGASYLAIGCAQAVATGVSVYAGYRITKELFEKKGVSLMYLICTVAFLPLYTYSIYIYGEAFGICMLLLSIWFFLRANREDSTKKQQVLFFVISGVCMTIAYVARRGFLVVWVAMLILQLLILLRRRRLLPVAAVLLMFPLMTLGQSVTIRLAQQQIGKEYNVACPTIMWVAMGMMDAMDGNMSGPGSYNDFNRLTFIDCGYDEQAASGIAKTYIRERLEQWSRQPGEMLAFYKEKTLVQWNEPTYGAFAMTYFMDQPQEWVYKLYMDEAVSARVRAYLNRYQAVLYAAVFGYFVFIVRKGKDERVCFPGLLLLGGFCLSILWETKSRYVYPYIVFILPCAAFSLVYYADRAEELFRHVLSRIKGVGTSAKEK